jgi:hypothetical protein
MERSEQIEVLAAALCKAQAAIEPPVKTEKNPFFKSTYADLAEVWRVIRKPLTDNGLSVVQTASGGEHGSVTVETLLLHSGGQWIKSESRGEQSEKGASAVQALGSAITYLRRYSLMAMLGLAPVDDDGNEADKSESPKQPETADVSAWRKPIIDAIGKAVVSLEMGEEEKERVRERIAKATTRKVLEDIRDELEGQLAILDANTEKVAEAGFKEGAKA